MARSDWQTISGTTNNNNVFFTGIRWRYRDDLFGTTGYPTSREESNTDIIEYQPYVGKKNSGYTSNYYANWLTSNYKYSYNTTSGTDPSEATNTQNISTTYRFDKASVNTNYYLTQGGLSANNVMNTSGATSRIIQVPHCSDGTSKLRLYFYFAGNSGTAFTSATTNGIVTLETIPRASSITVNDANIGSATNIVINKASSSFTTTLYYKASGQSSWTKIVDKTSNQVYGWTVPTSFYSLIPNSKTIQCQFYAETYSGSTLVGTSATVTATFTATGNPIINSFTLQDTNSTTTALTGDSSKMVRYASNVKATVSTNGQNSATISSNKVNGVSTSGGIATFNSASTNSYQLVVTDSRGYTTSQTKTMTMIDYVPLTINATIKRHTPTDGKIDISFSGNYFNGSFGSQSNTLTVQYRYKQSSSSSWGSWTSLTATKSGNTYSGGTGSTPLKGFTYTNQYDFEIKAVDQIQTKSITGIRVSKGEPVYWWDSTSFGVSNEFKLGTGNLLSVNPPSGASARGKFRFLPATSYENIPGSTTESEVYFKALLKWICNTYPSDTDYIYYNMSVPNGRGPVTIHIYSNSTKDGTTGLPQYSEGLFISLDRLYHFGTFNYNWYWYSQARVSDVPTNNNQLTNGAGYITSSSLPSVTNGTFTITKSSGNSSIIGSPTYAKYGKVVELYFQLQATGTTNAGSNLFVGTISGIDKPKLAETKGVGFYGSILYVINITSDGTLTIRGLIGNTTANSDARGMSIKYLCA